MLLEYLLIDWKKIKCAIKICILWSVKCSRDSIQIKADICYAFFCSFTRQQHFGGLQIEMLKLGFKVQVFESNNFIILVSIISPSTTYSLINIIVDPGTSL